MHETVQAKAETGLLGHPRAMPFIVGAEAMDAFSFYGMQALLVLYMTKFLLLPGHAAHVAGLGGFRTAVELLYGKLSTNAFASAIQGLYAGLAYLTPIAGGILADRVLGRTRTIVLGAMLMSLGHFLMAFEVAFLPALFFLLLGLGCFGSNIATQLGELYTAGDPRRADAFQLFSLGVTTTVIASPIICGALAETYAWNWGFTAAGIGMLFGLVLYLAGLRFMPDAPTVTATASHASRTPNAGKPRFQALRPQKPRPQKRRPQKRRPQERRPQELSAEARAAQDPSAHELHRQQPHPHQTQRAGEGRAILALILLLPALALAMLGNQEIFNAYILWGDFTYNLVVFGHTMPVSWLISLDAFLGVFISVGVLVFWRWWDRRFRPVDESSRVIIGAALMAAAPLSLAIASAHAASTGHRLGLAWGLAFHTINGVGFFNLYPVGQSLFSRAAPPARAGLMMGVFRLHLFLANLAVGYLGGLLGQMPATQFWLLHAGLVTIGGVLLAANKWAFGDVLAPIST